MKKLSCLLLGLLLVVTGVAFAGGAAEPDTFELSFAHVYEPDLAYHQEAEWAAEQIEQRTDGRITVTVYPAGQLGSESEIVEGLDLGTTDIVYGGSAFLAGDYGNLGIAEAPFIFRDFNHWMAFAQSDLFEDLAEGYRNATGHHIVAPTYYGVRAVTSNVPINSPEDMQGLSIRVPDAPLYLMMPDAVGANATPIAFGEVYLALQQGVVDAQENPLPTIRGMAFYEVQDYINLTGHMVNTLMTVVRGDLWEQMSEDDRELISEVLWEAAMRSSNSIYEEEQELAEWFEQQGVTVNDNVDRQAFIELVEPKWTGPDAPWDEETLERMRALAD